MNARENISVPASFTRRELLALLGGGVAALAGCGGGGDGVAGVSSGGTGFSVGPITGMGSIIVNSIRFDDSAASITDDDGNALSRSQLRLGMLARVRSTNTTATTGTATSIIVGGELKGRISSINSAAQTFVVLGQTVHVTGSTLFVDEDAPLPGGFSFSSLTVDTIVEVHGVVDAVANTMQASLIEKENAPKLFRIEGLISNHDATARQFNIGSIRISYATTPADEIRVTPANGALVRVRLTAVLPPLPEPAVWEATRIRPPEEVADVDEAEVEGIITRFASTADFDVNGLRVNAAGAAFPEGTAGIVLRARVEVKGRISGGVLVATRVKLEGENDVDNLEFELHGTVSNLGANSFTLTSSGGIVVNVTFGASTVFDNGTAAGLANGRQVEVKGTVSGGTTIAATRIHFE